MKYSDLIDILEDIAPTEWFEDEDNSGIQVHDGKEDIKRVLVCLEVNDDVITEAASKKVDMIITHHPLLFHPLSKVEPGNPVGRYVIRAIQEGIDIYSSHLAFDTAVKGNNMYLADLLKLQDVARPDEDDDEELEDEYTITLLSDEEEDEEGFEYDVDEVGSIGYLPKAMNFREFQLYVERALDLPLHYVRCVDGGKEEIRKVAFCTGAGGDFIYTAVREGCDAYITGDLKLHEAQYAKAVGLTVIDAGHYGTEKIFTPNMAAQIRAQAGRSLEVLEAESNTNPYTL